MKKHYTALLFSLCFIGAPILTKAQENINSKTYTKPTVIIGKEIGVRADINGRLGFSYLKHKNENKSFRFRTFSTGIVVPNVSYLQSPLIRDFIALGAGGAFAFLKKKQLDNKFTYYHGWEPFVGAYVSLRHFGVYAGIGHTFGLTYDLSEKFNLNVELVPNVGFGMSQFHNGSNRSLLFKNSSNGLSFSLHYKISK